MVERVDEAPPGPGEVERGLPGELLLGARVIEEPPQQSSPGLFEGAGDVLGSEIRSAGVPAKLARPSTTIQPWTATQGHAPSPPTRCREDFDAYV
jgi:hypothetical protein